VKGRHTKRFQRNKGRDHRGHSSFSLITNDPGRTLDLEIDIGPQPADSMHHQFEMEIRDQWVNAFRMLINGALSPPPPPPPGLDLNRNTYV
jgi:hypothetical protein